MILCNQVYGELTTIVPIKIGKRTSGWLCRCSCGNTHEVLEWYLRRGIVKTCGHCYLNREHKLAYNTWRSMRARCYDIKDAAYHLYGGRGITISQDWMQFRVFLADMGDPPIVAGTRLTIDRIDPNGNYEKSNCRWSDRMTQANNKRASLNILKTTFKIVLDTD